MNEGRPAAARTEQEAPLSPSRALDLSSHGEDAAPAPSLHGGAAAPAQPSSVDTGPARVAFGADDEY